MKFGTQISPLFYYKVAKEQNYKEKTERSQKSKKFVQLLMAHIFQLKFRAAAE